MTHTSCIHMTSMFIYCQIKYYAGVAELADALDLGSSAARRGGSSPFTRIITFLNGNITCRLSSVGRASDL